MWTPISKDWISNKKYKQLPTMGSWELNGFTGKFYLLWTERTLQKIRSSPNTCYPMSVKLFGNRIFADSLRHMLRWDHIGVKENHGTNSTSEPSEGINPANIWISNFWAPKIRERINFCCFKPHSLLWHSKETSTLPDV